MTGFLNDNRFIYAKPLSDGMFLPRTATCAGLRCSTYHQGQPSTKRTPGCANCLKHTHYTNQCPNNKRCKVCKQLQEGHTPGAGEREFYTKPSQKVIPFVGQDNSLSNFFPCDINVFGVMHKSAEHPFQYVNAMRSSSIPRATAIQAAKSALEANKIGKLVTLSPSFTSNQIEFMSEILNAY